MPCATRSKLKERAKGIPGGEADLEVDLRDPASVGVAGGDLHDVSGYGELVHGLHALLPEVVYQGPQHVVDRGLNLLDAGDVV